MAWKASSASAGFWRMRRQTLSTMGPCRATRVVNARSPDGSRLTANRSSRSLSVSPVATPSRKRISRSGEPRPRFSPLIRLSSPSGIRRRSTSKMQPEARSNPVAFQKSREAPRSAPAGIRCGHRSRPLSPLVIEIRPEESRLVVRRARRARAHEPGRSETPLDVPAASLYPIADLMPGCNGNGMRPRRGIRANDVAPSDEPSSRGPVPDDAPTHVARSVSPRKPSYPRAARRRDRSPPDFRHRTPMDRAATGMVAGAGDPLRRTPRPLELKE